MKMFVAVVLMAAIATSYASPLSRPKRASYGQPIRYNFNRLFHNADVHVTCEHHDCHQDTAHQIMFNKPKSPYGDYYGDYNYGYHDYGMNGGGYGHQQQSYQPMPTYQPMPSYKPMPSYSPPPSYRPKPQMMSGYGMQPSYRPKVIIIKKIIEASSTTLPGK